MEDHYKTNYTDLLPYIGYPPENFIKISLWLANNKIRYLMESSPKKNSEQKALDHLVVLSTDEINHKNSKQTFHQVMWQGEFVCHKHFMTIFDIIIHERLPVIS